MVARVRGEASVEQEIERLAVRKVDMPEALEDEGGPPHGGTWFGAAG